ncbi:hypothetical protein AN618_01170 [Fervidicola ferrireducens]|uniref:Uncharacterized protein n=1 Tax=Fervidicola ferrireducens TaxID=520764 RepID=A0A140LE04_9FIRM|nr:hypothetical protein [Fervidicola ferrireducens]KXG78779.1 hypothetical protein AN618_01170 [Fervidicola ferrireducens]
MSINYTVKILLVEDSKLSTKMTGVDSENHRHLHSIFTAHVDKEIMDKIKAVTSYGYIKNGFEENVLNLYTIETALKLYRANVLLTAAGLRIT